MGRPRKVAGAGQLQGRFLRVAEAARELNVSEEFVTKLMETGKLRYFSFSYEGAARSVRRITRQDLEEFIDRSRRGGWAL